MKVETNSEFYAISRNLRDTADELYSLAKAFYRLGQDRVAEELTAIGDHLNVQAVRMIESWSSHITEGLDEARKETSQVLLLALRQATGIKSD
jgi:hypothetical protein